MTAKLESENDTFFISQGKKKHKIKISDVLWLQSEGNYTTICTTTAKYSIKKSLISTVTSLGNLFIQCHQRMYINPKHIDYFDGDLVFVNGFKIKMGITFKNRVIHSFSILKNGLS